MDFGNTLQSFAVLQRNNENVSAHKFAGSAKSCGDLLLTVKNADGMILEGFDKVFAAARSAALSTVCRWADHRR